MNTFLDEDFKILKKINDVKSIQDVEDIKISPEFLNLKIKNLVNILLNTCIDDLKNNNINEDGTCSDVSEMLSEFINTYRS